MSKLKMRENLSAEENNNLLAMGYKYRVEGEFHNFHIDGKGYPSCDSYWVYFNDKAEAEAYAQTQESPYWKGCYSSVEEVEHEETADEYEARLGAEKAARQAKSMARDHKKAVELGLTDEEYKKYKTVKRRYDNNRREAENSRASIKYHERNIVECEKKMAECVAEFPQLASKG